MKRMDFFCASPASTAVCSSLDHRSMVRHGRTIPVDRANSKPYPPCSSQLPITPKPYYDKIRKSTSANQTDHLHRRSSAERKDYSTTSSVKPTDFRRKSSAEKSDLRTPAGSSRHLLGDRPYIDWVSESDHVSALVPSQVIHSKPRHIKSSNNDQNSQDRRSSSLAISHGFIPETDDRVTALVPSQPPKSRHFLSDDSPALRSSASARTRHDQVVVLRVSIHCKGCEGKVRKHISKMEGVKSFSIDLATKKVTIIGDVTPLGVLASISKVKNAQLWPSSSSLLPSPQWST